MDPQEDTGYHSYSWHQSHDQATVLLIVPYNTSDENVEITLERDHLVAGVRGQPPIVKGRLYGVVDPTASVWQLEPRASRLPPRERTISATSTVSSQSSYAYVSEQDAASSFAASLDNGMLSSDWEATPTSTSSPLSSPVWSSGDEQIGFHPIRRRTHPTTSRATSPPRGVPSSFASSISSIESLQSHYGRLLTLHLEKAESVIWPCLIAGPVSASTSPCLPGPPGSDPGLEHKYNLDPTSLTLLGLDLYDIRKDKQEAFECFVRAWHQSHVPSAALRLVTHFIPPLPLAASSSDSTLGEATPSSSIVESASPTRGTSEYYCQSVGGQQILAQLYREVGMIHLEGSAPIMLLSSSSSLSLSSFRLPSLPGASHSPPQTWSSRSGAPGSGGKEAWQRDQVHAKQCFDAARALWPELDVPTISVSDLEPGDGRAPSPSGALGLQMPQVDVLASASSVHSGGDKPRTRRRRKQPDDDTKELALTKTGASSVASLREQIDDDHGWVLYVPGLIGAGTALVAVAVVGALSFSTWRKNQN